MKLEECLQLCPLTPLRERSWGEWASDTTKGLITYLFFFFITNRNARDYSTGILNDWLTDKQFLQLSFTSMRDEKVHHLSPRRVKSMVRAKEETISYLAFKQLLELHKDKPLSDKQILAMGPKQQLALIGYSEHDPKLSKQLIRVVQQMELKQWLILRREAKSLCSEIRLFLCNYHPAPKQPFIDQEIPDGIRTVQAKKFSNGLETSLQGYTVLSGNVRNFASTPIASCGSTASREILLLDPNDSPKLAAHYEHLQKQIGEETDTEVILKKVAQYIQKEIFPGTKVESLINRARQTHQTTTHRDYPEQKIPLIPIDTFIENQVGVCRHHALVLAYLLDRLKQDGKLDGTIHHIRDAVQGGAHVWVNFIPRHKAGESHAKWHLDSLWDVLENYATQLGYENLRIYGKARKNQISRTDPSAKKMGQFTGLPRPPQIPSRAD
ncbi:MAG: hypothetical protein KDK65_06275 [Chlamydiia bacterium]|nr:hypothetical protein [Chlamydiia bacterium]